MKITGIAQPEPLHRLEEKPEEKVGAARKKGSRTMDVVELSSALDQQGTAQLQRAQAQRVAEIKSRLEEGAYRVDSRLVAEKMLSAGSGL